MEQAGIRMVCVLDAEYPSNLRMIHQHPPVLFLRGTADESDATSVAVVGTRQPTPRGIHQARQLATGLAASGIPVINGDHPLVRIAGTLVGQTRDRYQPVLALGPDASAEGRAVLVNRYRTTQAMTDGPAVLLIDDTWTTGGRAQSAAIALHDAGAAKVAVVVLGRHFDRDFGSGETYYQQARSRKFSWDSCCVEMEEQQT